MEFHKKGSKAPQGGRVQGENFSSKGNEGEYGRKWGGGGGKFKKRKFLCERKKGATQVSEKEGHTSELYSG